METFEHNLKLSDMAGRDNKPGIYFFSAAGESFSLYIADPAEEYEEEDGPDGDYTCSIEKGRPIPPSSVGFRDVGEALAKYCIRGRPLSAYDPVVSYYKPFVVFGDMIFPDR